MWSFENLEILDLIDLIFLKQLNNFYQFISCLMVTGVSLSILIEIFQILTMKYTLIAKYFYQLNFNIEQLYCSIHNKSDLV